jgi:hypothetical protein
VPTPNPANHPEAIDDYLAAFEQALERVPAPLRHSEVDALREELSWLDSRGSAALLDSLGSPTVAARAILVRKIAADELRGRRAAVAAIGVGAGIVAIAVILGRRSLRTRCSCGPVSGGPRPR